MDLPPLSYRVPENPGYLRLAGPDRVAYLQRQTTNDVRLLGPARAVTTVLTNPSARILDVLQLIAEPESTGILSLPGRGAATYQFFKRRIFFTDHITLTDLSSEIFLADLEGPEAASALPALGVATPPALEEVAHGQVGEVGLPPGASPSWRQAGETEVTVLGQPGLAGTGYRVLAPVSARESVLAALEAAGASPLPPEAYEIFRVEAGLPAAHSELTEEYTPLETGLSAAISSTKGCYTGQEVIARQITYDKITRHLVGLRLEDAVQAGARVLAEGRSVGEVTSAVVSPRLGPLALAVVKRPHNQPGSVIEIEHTQGNIRGEVTELPFRS